MSHQDTHTPHSSETALQEHAHPQSNQTVADLRTSLGLTPSQESAVLSITAQSEESPIIPSSPDVGLANQIRAKFGGLGGTPANFFEHYPSVFSLSGYADADPIRRFELVHDIIVDRDFTFLPRLGRLARRTLYAGKLERLDDAIKKFVEDAADDHPHSAPDVLSKMVAEQAVWSQVAELRDLMLDIVMARCDASLLDQVTEILSPSFIAQMVAEGAYNSGQFVNTLDAIQQLVEQAAPICVFRYDYWYQPVRQQLLSRRLGTASDFPYLVMELTETLQDIKLELANWRLSLQRPSIVQAAIQWEVHMTAASMQTIPALANTIHAIQRTATVLQEASLPISCTTLHNKLMLDLLTAERPPEIPEVFSLDADRITGWRRRLRMICLACALFAASEPAMRRNQIETTPELLTEIRCSMFDPSVGFSCDDHRGWALTFFRWLHSAAADQDKTIPVDETSFCRLSSQLIAAADPEGPIRKLFLSRVTRMLQHRAGFGAATEMDQEERLRYGHSFALAASELSDLLDSASMVACHLSTLYSPMYAPFLQTKQLSADALLPEIVPQERNQKQMEVSQAEELEEEEEEEEEYVQNRSFELSFPGLQTLSYEKSSDKRASSCGVPLKRQPSCGEVASPMQRQRTLDFSSLHGK